MKKPLGLFFVGSLLGAVALAAIYYCREGAWGVAKAAAAAVVCVIPGVVSLAWVLWSQSRDAAQQLLATMGGMVLRMAGALGGGFAFYHMVPSFRADRGGTLSFWAAVLLSYLGTLALETTLATRSRFVLASERRR